jgi:hypothetical protein
MFSLFHTCSITYSTVCCQSRLVPPPYVCMRLPSYWLDFFLVWWKCFLGDVPFSSGTSSCHKVKHLENVADISFRDVNGSCSNDGLLGLYTMSRYLVCCDIPLRCNEPNILHMWKPKRQSWFARGRYSVGAHSNCDTNKVMGAFAPVQVMYPEIVAFMACLNLTCCPSLSSAVWIGPTHAPVQDGHSIGPTHAPVQDGHSIGPTHAPVQGGHSIGPTHAPVQDDHSSVLLSLSPSLVTSVLLSLSPSLVIAKCCHRLVQ